MNSAVRVRSTNSPAPMASASPSHSSATGTTTAETDQTSSCVSVTQTSSSAPTGIALVSHRTALEMFTRDLISSIQTEKSTVFKFSLLGLLKRSISQLGGLF